VHASVIVGRVNPERIDDLPSLYEAFLPTLRSAPGWLGIYVIAERSTGSGHVVGLWETEANAAAFETSGEFARLLASSRRES
jgi:heme-degrading monooxygenase HmoA